MTSKGSSDTDLIVVGAGPAGMLAGLLFARAGCMVQMLDQLGMLQRFLKRAHNRVESAQLRIAGRDWTIGDLSHLPTPAPFIAMMPQWDFLDFLREEAKAFPGFHLQMQAPVNGFLEERGRVTGVRLADGRELCSKLVIAADGRTSIVRALLPLEDLG